MEVFAPKAGKRPDHSSEFSYLADLDFFTKEVEEKPLKKTTRRPDFRREAFLKAFDMVLQSSNHYISGPFIDEFFPSHLQAVRRLGQGTFGTTFLVMDRTHGDYFALKAFYTTIPADSRKSVEFSTPQMI